MPASCLASHALRGALLGPPSRIAPRARDRRPEYRPTRLGRPLRISDIGADRKSSMAGCSPAITRTSDSAAAQALLFEVGQIVSPALLLLEHEHVQIGPHEKPGIMAVVEDDADRIIANGLELADLDAALAPNRHTLLLRVPLPLRRRTHHPQQLGWKLVHVARGERDPQSLPAMHYLELRGLLPFA